MNRQSRRAINDILTTVGVCVGVDADGQIRPVHDDGSLAALDKSKVTAVIRENEIGVLIGLAEALLDDLASMWAIGLRFRLQVCNKKEACEGIIIAEVDIPFVLWDTPDDHR